MQKRTAKTKKQSKKKSAKKAQTKQTTKKPPKKATIKKESAVRKIFKTTDGALSNAPRVKKERNVAAIEQRKDDGALAVVKIFSEEGKEEKIGKTFIPNLVLTPEQHSALTKRSIVGRQVIVGIKQGDSFKPIFIGDLEKTDDKLTRRELRKIRKQVNNNSHKNRRTYKKKIKRWRRHFKDN